MVSFKGAGFWGVQIVQSVYGFDNLRAKPVKFFQDMKKRLSFNFQSDILITLSLIESMEDLQLKEDLFVLFKNQLIDFHTNGKFEQLPEYAVHRILYLFDTIPKLQNDPGLRDPKQHLIATMQDKFSQFTPLRCSLHQDLSQLNCHYELPSYNLMMEGCGLEFLDDIQEILSPWEILLDLGHSCSYNYDYLLKALSEFRKMDERTMALTVINLATHHSGKDDQISRIINNTFEANKDGTPNALRKEPEDRKTQMTWSVDNLSRAFRELYPQTNWGRVFENFSDLKQEELPESIQENGLDTKQFATLMQIFNKCKPQNLVYPLLGLLTGTWNSPVLHLSFIKNSMLHYVSKKDKQINFIKLRNRVPIISELQEIKERGESLETIEVWQSVDLVEKLLALSEERGMFMKVRKVFEHPLKQLPEYLLLTLSMVKPLQGSVLIDELLSVLLPIFLGNHVNSSVVLQKLFEFNQKLFIRGICELCKHDQRLMNLSRVLDITQEVKESLISIVYCQDYNFAVNLGVLAGKRDFLHYDVWIQKQIKEVGSPFIDAIVKYITDHIIIPVKEFTKRNQAMEASNPENFDQQKNAILDRSHLSKEKLHLTIVHLKNPQNRQADKINGDTLDKIQLLQDATNDIFPQHQEPGQNSEEIEQQANENFQRVFSAETDQEVEERIEELIEKMMLYKQSENTREQEIYACMLHSLFDEYRFLHRYPPMYLNKIAKLFGAIIKNDLLDKVLQDIALKFVIEAFRRDGRRQKFGVIVVKSYFDQLPQNPSFLQDIYQIRQNIASTEPELMADIEQMYQDYYVNGGHAEKSMSQVSETAASEEQKVDEEPADGQKGFDFLAPPTDLDMSKKADAKKAAPESKQQQQQTAQTNPKGQKQGGKKGQMFNQTLTKPFTPSNTAGGNQQNWNSSSSPAHQSSQLQPPQQQQPGSLFKSVSPSAKDFVPSNSSHVQAYIPSQQQPSQYVDHVNFSGGMQQQNSNFAQLNMRGAQNSNNPSINFNLKSAEFQQLKLQGEGGQQTFLNLNNEFKPTKQEAPQSPYFKVTDPALVAELLEFREEITTKIKKAVEANSRIRISDLLEDQVCEVDEFIQDKIRMFFNQIDKNNFKQKMEDFKKLVATKDDKTKSFTVLEDSKLAGLKWFINTILIRRLSATSMTLQPLYVEMVWDLHTSISAIKKFSNVLGLTQYLAAVIFKKCLAVDESELAKSSTGSMQMVKEHLSCLGTFLGQLTLARNYALRRQYIDLKQILVEGYQRSTKRLVLIFICRILKEARESKSFGLLNPWFQTLISIISEIRNNSKDLDPQTKLELDSTFESLHPRVDPKHYGIISLLESPNALDTTGEIKEELQYIAKKKRMILPPNLLEKQEDVIGSSGSQAQQEKPDTEGVIVSEYTVSSMQRFDNFDEGAFRSAISKALDDSIVDILPPVINRSVTIALITTKELVLKDFAFDGDEQRVLLAADLIVQNLAGSLALVTCREPLRVTLTQNLKKGIENYFKAELRYSAGMDETEPMEKVVDKIISDVSVQLTNDNLDLGCRLIKKAVIDTAKKRVREELEIKEAIDARKHAKEAGVLYRDEVIAKQLEVLPAALLPNHDGLTATQFQVYQDFARLGQSSEEESVDLQSLLQLIQQPGNFEAQRSALQGKLIQMTKGATQEERERLWGFAKHNLEGLCRHFESQEAGRFELTAELLSMIVKNYRAEDLSRKLLQESFIIQDTKILKEADLVILMMSKGIIPVKDWDHQMAHIFSTQGLNLREEERQFFSSFLEKAIIEKKLLTKEDIPMLINAISSMQTHTTLGQYCSDILEKINSSIVNSEFQDRTSIQLRDFFLRWVVISHLDDGELRDKQINQFFQDLKVTGADKDSTQLLNFCKVMVITSISKSQFVDTEQTQPRPADRLDFRYIDSFVRLIIILIKMFNLNTHKFLTHILDYVKDVLKADHDQKKTDFNQRPYYRIFINILNAVSSSQAFSDKLRTSLMFSIASIFEQLRPQATPAFAFAWLELVSHRLFLPFFLKFQTQPIPFLIPKGGYPKKMDSAAFLEKRGKVKDLIGYIFLFLKASMIPGEIVPPAIQGFYHSTLRVVDVIRTDYPDFLSDYHFIFINQMPEHCIQLRNMILSACPKGINEPYPFYQELKVDLLQEIQLEPRILAHFEGILIETGLKELLENYNPQRNDVRIVEEICRKMEQGDESSKVRRPNTAVISAVVLFLAHQSTQPNDQRNRPSRELFKHISQRLNDEVRMCFFNAIVNELRFPSKHTFAFSCTILFIYAESGSERICEQISQIFLERLQAQGPYPWGLMISFRELIQNPKLEFMEKRYIQSHQEAIARLFLGKLRPFIEFLPPQSIQNNPIFMSSLKDENTAQ